MSRKKLQKNRIYYFDENSFFFATDSAIYEGVKFKKQLNYDIKHTIFVQEVEDVQDDDIKMLIKSFNLKPPFYFVLGFTTHRK